MHIGFSKVVGSVFLFGFGMFTIGLLLAIFKGAFVNRIKNMYWVEDTPFLNLMDVEYNIMALIIMIMGIVCVFVSAAEARSQKVNN